MAVWPRRVLIYNCNHEMPIAYRKLCRSLFSNHVNFDHSRVLVEIIQMSRHNGSSTFLEPHLLATIIDFCNVSSTLESRRDVVVGETSCRPPPAVSTWRDNIDYLSPRLWIIASHSRVYRVRGDYNFRRKVKSTADLLYTSADQRIGLPWFYITFGSCSETGSLDVSDSRIYHPI